MNFDQKLWFRIFLILIAISGWIFSAVSLPVFNNKRARIVYRVESMSLYSPSYLFNTEIAINGSPYKSYDQIAESVITIWNNGNASIAASDIRRPLKISGSSNLKILAYRTLNYDSALSNNFDVTNDGARVELRWKLFDPKDAIKLAILRTEPKESLSVTANLGTSGEVYEFFYAGGTGIIITIVLLIPFFISAMWLINLMQNSKRLLSLQFPIFMAYFLAGTVILFYIDYKFILPQIVGSDSPF